MWSAQTAERKQTRKKTRTRRNLLTLFPSERLSILATASVKIVQPMAKTGRQGNRIVSRRTNKVVGKLPRMYTLTLDSIGDRLVNSREEERAFFSASSCGVFVDPETTNKFLLL